jgi:dTDP-4-dehydrorhamnose 3,5-epimerase
MTSLHLEKSKLDGVLVTTPPTSFEDFRGSYIEIYNEHIYQAAGLNQRFIQDDISTSNRNVLRGIHGDKKTWKLVTCLYGSFYLVVVNNDEKSSQFKQWTSFTLSDQNRLQVLIPPNFGNGHLVLSDSAIFHYKQTTEYDRSSQFTIQWNDPEFNFWWPTSNPILSMRDSGLSQ